MNKTRILLWIICLLALWGMLELFFFWQTEMRSLPFYLANIIFHLPIFIGFIWLLWKGQPRFRLSWFWTPVGLLMIIWPTLTVIFADVLDPNKYDQYGLMTFFTLSETFWYGWAFGLLLGFFSIKSLGKFWWFFLPIALAWNGQHLSLLLQSLGSSGGLGQGAPTLASYFQSGKFWNDWGWFLADLIVDVPLALVAAGMIIVNIYHSFIHSTNKLKTCLLILVLILVMVILGIIVEKLSEAKPPTVVSPTESGKEQKPTLKFQPLRKINLGEGIYSNFVFAHNRFYLSYEIIGQGIFLNIYDQDFNFQEKSQLTGFEGGDHQLVYGEGYFYLVSSFNIRKFDSNWQEVKSISALADLPTEVSDQWLPDRKQDLDDMLFYYYNGSLYLGIPGSLIGPKDIKAGEKKPDAPDYLFIRQLDQDLTVKNEALLKDLGNTPGSSMIARENGFTIVCADKHWNDSSLIRVRYDRNWNLVDKKIISAVERANEEFAMGSFWVKDADLFSHSSVQKISEICEKKICGYFFVVYQYITGDLSQPTIGEPVRRVDVMLKAFDQDWNLLDQVIVTEDLSNDDLHTHLRAPHLALVDNKLYVAYSIESGSPKILVKEYQIEKKDL